MIRNDRFATVRIRSTGQVTEMAPHPARAMIASGIAVEVEESSQPESMAVAPFAEQAVAPAQSGPTRKPLFGKKRA